MKLNSPFHGHAEAEIADWLGDNSPVTRFKQIGAFEIMQAADDDGGIGTWYYGVGGPGVWAESVTLNDAIVPVNLPHGATITAFRVTCQETAPAYLAAFLQKERYSDGAIFDIGDIAATTSQVEQEDTTLNNAVVDNNTYHTYVILRHATNVVAVKIWSIEIEYTVVRPQP